MDIRDRFDRALDRRAALLANPTLEAVRIVHDAADGLEGLAIEKFGPVFIVQIHEGRCRIDPPALEPHVANLMDRLGVRAAYLKIFSRDRAAGEQAHRARHTDSTPWLGTAVEPSLAVREGELRMMIRPYDGFSVGLFLEHRDNRAKIRQLASGTSVLNLFAYTCGFSIAAALGGATQVSSVDLSKRYLDWGRENFVASGLDASRHLFFCSDAFEFFRRARRQQRRYDLIVLDPPTFSRLRRPARVFVLADQLEALCREAVDLLHVGGRLLFATNNRGLSRSRIEAAMRSAARRAITSLEWLPLPADFAGDAEYSKAVLATLD